MKSVAGNLEHVFPVFQFLRNPARLTDEENHFKHIFKYALFIYISAYNITYCMQKCKPVKSAASLDSVFNLIPCIYSKDTEGP